MRGALGKFTNNLQKKVYPRRCKALGNSLASALLPAVPKPKPAGWSPVPPWTPGLSPAQRTPPTRGPEPRAPAAELRPQSWDVSPEASPGPRPAVLTPTVPSSPTLRVETKWDPTLICDRAPPRQSSRQGCCGRSPTQRNATPTLPQPHRHTQTPGARKLIHGSSETHRHWYTNATLKAYTAGQEGAHKCTKRCRDRDTKGRT